MRTVVLNEAAKNDILENLLKRSPNSYGKYEASVAAILADVKEKKDEALFEYTRKFDGADIDASNIVVTKEEIEEALESEYENREQEQIRALMYKKHFSFETADQAEVRRMYQFLLRRGFRSSDISHVMRETGEEIVEEDSFTL